jgi:multidrug efflux pump subunit AcrA (membrane-fusion protein)
MKTFSCLALLIAVFLSAGCSKSADEKTLYTCGMHPQIIQDQPGSCPICGMTLVPVKKQAATQASAHQPSGRRQIKYYKSTMMLGEVSQTPRKDSMGMEMVPVYEGEEERDTISVDAVTIQKMGIRTAPVTRGPLRRSIRTVGTVDFNETALADVTTRFSGFIEKLYVDSTGQEVRKGEPLFEIYSPELYSAQNEYVLALNSGGTLKASARQKLILYDISEDQIAEIEKTRQPQRTLSVRAPIDGVVVEKTVVQGQRAEAGMKLYRLADLGLVWVQSQIYEQDLAYIKVGQEAEVSLSYLPDRKFRGRVTYIYPTVDEKTRTARVRMEFHNPGLFLKPGMFATVEIRAELERAVLLIPDTAILRSGETNTVFVARGDGKFEPRSITLGPRSENNAYQVLTGLKEGEQVVTSGQFMLDSESQLREAIQKMLNPQASPRSPVAEPLAQASPAPVITPAPAALSKPAEFICPMAEHASIKYDHGGKCPICGMTLIPFTGQPEPSPAETPAQKH